MTLKDIKAPSLGPGVAAVSNRAAILEPRGSGYTFQSEFEGFLLSDLLQGASEAQWMRSSRRWGCGT